MITVAGLTVLSAPVLADEVVNQLPFPGVFFGLIAFAIFMTFGFVMWSYRDVANRHPKKSAEFARPRTSSYFEPARRAASIDCSNDRRSP